MTTDFYTGSDFTKEYYHKEQLAVIKLLMEKQGFIKGAFYREDTGDIDLLWGNEDFGLCHILKRRSEQFGEEKALRFISHLQENIRNGVIVKAKHGRIGIITNKSTIILEQCQDNHFILTAYIDRTNELRLENLQSVHDIDFIDESVSRLNKGFDVLSSNQSHNPILPKKIEPKPQRQKENEIIPTPNKRRGR
ncbi:hypothetical protein [Helicobacter cappadocius]|uniref:Phage-Barnase-EndoU-ColicinE5/D-RelE-like nuclease domain-containing protein n=1 Tax=Helicobacter cappadocius TaxID=3063998 RepID=A0AA90Q229_9HELI|nr:MULTISPECIES: hypothetical protein [unclassified Helicobacter]MDO7253076.1 hypothetical protein [Helicobacter sp. faydin-H75]MDP2538798.1 hypothetical protein [Helicobacter sp. faydin-H76]